MGIKRSTWQIEVAKEKHIKMLKIWNETEYLVRTSSLKMLGDAWWRLKMLDYAW